jgi:hypothetical protein
MADTLTMEDLNTFKEICDNANDDDKILNFRGFYIEPDTVSKAIDDLTKKVCMASLGLYMLTDSDKLLLSIIYSQKGYNY